MQLNFKKDVLKLDLYGEKYEVNFPTALAVNSYNEKMKDLEESDAIFKVISEYLDELGIPQEKVLEMQMDHLMQLMEVINGQKKS